MAYALSIGGQTFNLLNPNDLGFSNTSFGPNGVTTFPEKLTKCPNTHPSNPPNDCGLVLTTHTLATQYDTQANIRAAILTEVQRLSDADSFSNAIDGAKQLENYFLDMGQVFAQRRDYAAYLRGYSRVTKDKWRCCYNNQQLDSAIAVADVRMQQALEEGFACKQLVTDIEALQSAVTNSTLTEFEVEEQRARTNYQIAQTNQQIAKEGFITSQFALKEGSGKIVIVVMALVAAFLVYRFVIRK